MNWKSWFNMDSLQTAIEIMTYLQDNYESVKEQQVIDKFGKKNWHMFSQWGMNSDASTKGEAYAVERVGTINLTQLGARKLYELRGIIADEKRAEWIKWATIILAIFAVTEFSIEMIKIMD